MTVFDNIRARNELGHEGDRRKELEYDLNRDIRHEEWTAQLDRQDTPVAELPTEPADQYLGYTDGELVRDVRSGATGRVRVRDDEEVGRYAEVAWDGSFVSDQLEVAVDNGLDRVPGPRVNVIEAEQGDELLAADDDAAVREQRDAALITSARDWIGDCTWADLSLDDVAELSDEEVLWGVEQHFDGGLAAFVAVDVAEPELAADEVGVDGPAELVGPQLDDAEVELDESGPVTEPDATDVEVQGELNEPGMGIDDAELQVAVEPEVVLAEPGLAVDVAEAELDTDDGTPDAETTPTPDPGQPSWWRSHYQQAKGRLDDKVQFAKDWVRELRSGKHTQCHGAWEQHGPFGGVSECANQVAVNTFGVTVEDLRETYGHNFVNDVLYRNDVQRQSFDKIADSIQRTQLGDREPELER